MLLLAAHEALPPLVFEEALHVESGDLPYSSFAQCRNHVVVEHLNVGAKSLGLVVWFDAIAPFIDVHAKGDVSIRDSGEPLRLDDRFR